MSVYRLTPLARADLADIWDYSREQWGVDRAEAYIGQIRGVLDLASANPRLGRACDDIRPGYFKLIAGSHLLFYRRAGADIEVVRNRHQRMDVSRHL